MNWGAIGAALIAAGYAYYNSKDPNEPGAQYPTGSGQSGEDDMSEWGWGSAFSPDVDKIDQQTPISYHTPTINVQSGIINFGEELRTMIEGSPENGGLAVSPSIQPPDYNIWPQGGLGGASYYNPLQVSPTPYSVAGYAPTTLATQPQESGIGWLPILIVGGGLAAVLLLKKK